MMAVESGANPALVNQAPAGLGPSGFDRGEGVDWNAVRDAQPPAPNCDMPVEVEVVARRCVYVNNYRVAGSKPYHGEGLSRHTLQTTLGEVLEAFTEKQIRAALREQKARRDYYALIHTAISVAAGQ